MGFLTPTCELGEYLTWRRPREIQLSDFQRGYKWENDRIRELLVTVLRGHPLGAVELLKTGNAQVRFEARRESLCKLVDAAINKNVQRDIEQGLPTKTYQFKPDELAEDHPTETD